MKSLLSSQHGTTMDNPTETPYESDLAPLLSVWDQAHPAVADPEWRHLLDELAHPHTTQAFHRLAGAAA
ncbi:hypothetical protein ADK57_29825 [Streptomyces sp. MMG1533]|uniref:hypothetical protein n=1 Tax=Streptomyces sp. MMG1533 TaxID=1415546 RepID=UPI0006AF1B6E|nr:hypothetical protein [Streptomyces sp. MMG1533]KOU60597.1 hypothetical protein ADK57_29825 [Streptomyces sp. MMG1533]